MKASRVILMRRRERTEDEGVGVEGVDCLDDERLWC